MSDGVAALLKWIVGTIIAVIAAGGGATAWLKYAKDNQIWPFAPGYVIIEHITVTQGDGTTIDPPIQVEVSVNGKNYYYPTKTDPTQDGSKVRASQIKNVRIPVARERKYYVTIKLSGRVPFTSSDSFSFPSDYPFSQVVTAQLLRKQRPSDSDPTATAVVDLTVKNN
jgi:hypothetical protein